MDACTILQRTATFFREHPEKWIKGTYADEHGGYCLIGRILREAHEGPMRGMLTTTAAAGRAEVLVSNETHRRYLTTPTTFNDKATTTLKDILIVVDAAIEKACK